MPDGYFIKAGAVAQVEMFEGLRRRTLATTDEAMLCEFSLKAGCNVQSHNHMNDQVGYVVRGKFEMTIGNETRIVEAGDCYAIPGGIYHSLRVIEDSVIIDVFSPPREDYRTEAR